MDRKFLHREDAPFGDQVWEAIDKTVVATAKSQLCARRLLHIQGPYGLGMTTLPSGDKLIDEKTTGTARMTAPCVTPLAMIQSEFSVPVRDIAAFEASGLPLDLGDAAQAAGDCARQEDHLVFNGSQTLGLKGLLGIAGSHSLKLQSWDTLGASADDIIHAVTVLDEAGFPGPYTLALCPERYNLLYRRYAQGNQTEMEHIRQIITDGIINTRAISSGGIVLHSNPHLAGIILGQDLTTAFAGPSGNAYTFTVSESLALRITEPRALCILQK